MATLRKRGSKWHVQIRKNHFSQTRTFSRKGDAVEWALETERQVERRGLPADPRALERLTVTDLVTRFRDNVVPLRRSRKVETVIPASDAAFALLADYYDELNRIGLQPGDAERLLRLISDDRVRLFRPFPLAVLKSDDVAARIRRPLLARLSRLAAERPSQTSADLEQIARQLPPGAYREDYADLDALLATTEGQQRFPALMPRLADRGNDVATRLVAIIRESTGAENSPVSTATARAMQALRADKNWRSGGIAAEALQGLCMLGPNAATALPELRRMAAEGLIPQNMQRSDRWRMSLIKIGARANEFEKPSNVSGSQSQYEERVAKDAQRRSCTSF